MKHPKELPEVEPVVLKPVFGIKPGIYLLVIYTIIILLVLFLIGFLPGIVKGGRYVTFQSVLSGSGIEVDGTYLGSADYQYFIESGEHEIIVRKADVIVTKETLKIDHPLFFTWLVHRTKKVGLPLGELTAEEKRKILAFDLEEIVRYSAITEYDKVTVYPPLFENLRKDNEALKGNEDILSLAANFITSGTMYDEAEQTVPETEAAMQAAKALFAEGNGQKQFGEKARQTTVKGKRTTLKGPFEQDGIAYEAHDFVMGDTAMNIYPDTNEAGVDVHTESFAIATTPVSQYQWALFMEANPSWAKDKKDTLLQESKTDDSYLAGISPTSSFSGARPVTNISWNAAEAFCSWLSKETGKEIFLPSEAEWTLAAMSAGDKTQEKTMSIADDLSDSPSGMLGGVWEMTSTPYIPLARLTDYDGVHKEFASYGIASDIIVKGGSYLTKGITKESVGAITQDACGEAIGFRIAWKEK